MQRTYPGPVTDSCFVDEIDVILAVEDNKSIKGQWSCWTDVDGVVDVSLGDSFCNVSSFSFPNIEYFFCCFETQILAISSRQIFLKNVPE